MTKYYSKNELGFYEDGIHTVEQIPSDALEISEERHAELMADQSTGKYIVSDGAGLPVSVSPAPLTADEIFENQRREEYSKEGVTIAAMVVALWENDPVVIAEIETKRQAVKLRVPKS